jgi:pimeloyl-ACP methyl ester carboxylesterase
VSSVDRRGPRPSRLSRFSREGLVFDVVDDGPLDGEVVLALHGFPQTSAIWEAVTPMLTRAGYRVLAPDQRGYSRGARPHDVSAYRLDRLVGDVLGLADAAGASSFHLVGHDWGGGIAWVVAASHPDRVRTLSVASAPHPRALIASLCGPQLLRSWYIGLFQIPRLPELLLSTRDAALLRRLMQASGPAGVEDAVRLFAEPGAATATLNWYRAMSRPGITAPGKVSVPVLYVWGDQDAALGRRAAELTRRWVAGSYRFVVLPGATHWIPTERPREFGELVLAQLRNYRSTPPA